MKETDGVMAIVLVILSLIAFGICALHLLAESQKPVEYKQSDMTGACRYSANQILAREE